MSFEKELTRMIKENGFDVVVDAAVKLKKHHTNPVYVKAWELFQETQATQIEKGAEKYPEPLNPDSWTIKELAQHAFDEAVDLTHYITALKIKAEKLEKEKSNLIDIAKKHGDIIGNLGGKLEIQKKETERWKNDATEYSRRLDEVSDKLFDAGQEIEGLERILDEYKTRSFSQTQDIARLDEKVAIIMAAKDELMKDAASRIADLERELEELKNGKLV